MLSCAKPTQLVQARHGERPVHSADETVHDSLDVTAVVADCALTCARSTDRAVCEACIGEGSGLTSECRDCYVDHVTCGVKHCIALCIADSSAPLCIECQLEHCIPAWEACTGRVSTLAERRPSDA